MPWAKSKSLGFTTNAKRMRGLSIGLSPPSPHRDCCVICIYGRGRMNPRLEIGRQTIIRIKKDNKYTYFWCVKDNCLVEKPFVGKSIFTQVRKMKLLFAECTEFEVFLMREWWHSIRADWVAWLWGIVRLIAQFDQGLECSSNAKVILNIILQLLCAFKSRQYQRLWQ